MLPVSQIKMCSKFEANAIQKNRHPFAVAIATLIPVSLLVPFNFVSLGSKDQLRLRSHGCDFGAVQNHGHNCLHKAVR